MNLIEIIILKMLLKERLPLILKEKILMKKIPVKKTMIKNILMKKFKSTKNSCRRKKKKKKLWNRHKNIAEGQWQKLIEYMRNIVHFRNLKAIRFVFLDESSRYLGTFLDILLDLSQVNEFFTTKEMLPTTTALSNAYHLCGSF